MEEKIRDLYQIVEQYATQKELENTKLALPLVEAALEEKGILRFNDKEYYKDSFYHCLMVVEMLIDLHIALEHQEEDILLSATLCHILPEIRSFNTVKNLLCKDHPFDPAIYEIVMLILQERDMSEQEQKQYFEKIQKNKLALLIELADRGNIIQQLHAYSSWSAHRYIFETRTYYFPMCIYGKEQYHELLGPISILMEKMRSLMEVTEIFLKRYEDREIELIQDILAMKEENATIKGIIQKLSAREK